MGSGNGIIDQLQNGLTFWSDKLQEIWTIMLQSPESFKGGGVWSVIRGINGALQATGMALLIIFFLIGVMKTCGNFAEMKRPEVAVKMFVRFICAKAAITYGMELMLTLFRITQGIVGTIMDNAGIGGTASTLTVPSEIVTAVMDMGFFESIGPWVISLIACLVIIVISFILVLNVYGRFFRLYLYVAIAPIPLAAFAGEPSASIGKAFLKGFASVCLEGAIIVLACVIFGAFAATPPVIQAGASPVAMVLTYSAEIIFNMLVLAATVKMSDRVTRDIFGT